MSFMGKTTKRKLFLFGRYSLALLPPKKSLSELGVKAGDVAQVVLDRPKKRLVITFDVPDASTTPAESPKKTSKAAQPKDGWQQIPEL